MSAARLPSATDNCTSGENARRRSNGATTRSSADVTFQAGPSDLTWMRRTSSRPYSLAFCSMYLATASKPSEPAVGPVVVGEPADVLVAHVAGDLVHQDPVDGVGQER